MSKRKVSLSHIHWLDTGIFPAKVMFIVNFSHEDVLKYLKKVKADYWLMGIESEADKFAKGCHFSLKRTVINHTTKGETTLFYIIINRAFDFSDWDMTMLAHEILHTCQFMLPDILDRNREFECEAYLHSHLMTQCLKILRS